MLGLFKAVHSFDYFRYHKLCFAVSVLLCIGTAVSLATRGLNFGVDFAGGVLIELRTPGAADLADMRAKLNNLNLGDVALQEFGSPNDILIRVQRQGASEQEEMASVKRIQAVLGEQVEYRRIEVVGPRVSGELVQSGIIGVALALFGIWLYLWFRFEWQFAIGAMIATMHDIVLTIGFYCVTQLDFDLSSIAAILTIAGYSLNDTVVVYDRIRELLRRYKKMVIDELLDLSVNTTLPRTVITSVTTFLAMLALTIFGGEVIQSFTRAMLFGIVVGVYSTTFIAAPLLIYLGVRTRTVEGAAGAVAASASTPTP